LKIYFCPKKADDVVKLLKNDDLRLEFGEKGRELAVERYNTDKVIPQYIEFYEKVLAKSAP
jgi:glycosyltransferase involved in cell wall biosynthesis